MLRIQLGQHFDEEILCLVGALAMAVGPLPHIRALMDVPMPVTAEGGGNPSAHPVGDSNDGVEPGADSRGDRHRERVYRFHPVAGRDRAGNHPQCRVAECRPGSNGMVCHLRAQRLM
ncbi:MAG: hypothetical protein WBG92_07330 [Thiohalocapsa sp.]